MFLRNPITAGHFAATSLVFASGMRMSLVEEVRWDDLHTNSVPPARVDGLIERTVKEHSAYVRAPDAFEEEWVRVSPEEVDAFKRLARAPQTMRDVLGIFSDISDRTRELVEERIDEHIARDAGRDDNNSWAREHDLTNLSRRPFLSPRTVVRPTHRRPSMGKEGPLGTYVGHANLITSQYDANTGGILN